jgi:hypothetical protein
MFVTGIQPASLFVNILLHLRNKQGTLAEDL